MLAIDDRLARLILQNMDTVTVSLCKERTSALLLPFFFRSVASASGRKLPSANG